MAEKRFTHKKWYNERQLFDDEEPFAIVDVYNQADKICDKLNELHEENEDITLLAQHNYEESKRIINRYVDKIKELEKEIHLIHMTSMFSTVKSFKGDVSKRYEYSEETDTIYDTANTYGQYDKILDKKEIVMLLNEYETLLNGGDLND